VLPDIKITELIHLGPIPVHLFGILVAVGVLAGRSLALYRAKQAGIPQEEMDEAILYTLITAFIFAHFFEAVFYHPERIAQQGLIYLLKVWDGLSSFGGFLGGIFGFLLFVYQKKVRFPLLYAECILQGLILGWIFGRLGCTLVFDHPGKPSNFFLAFQQPGGSRHNLGFYEFLFTLLILFPVTLGLHHRKAKPGTYFAAVLLLYSPVRFFLDFLRLDIDQKGDIRYLGLTPGQYASVLFFILGLFFVSKRFEAPSSPPRLKNAMPAKKNKKNRS